MKVLVILIVMFFPDPTYSGKDSVRIHTHNGKPLYFTNADDCEKWILNDIDNLKTYAKKIFPEAVTIKQIMCVNKGQET